MALYIPLLIVTIILVLLFLSFYGMKVGRYLYLSMKLPGPSWWQLPSLFYNLQNTDLASYTAKICASYGYKPIGSWFWNGLLIFVSDCHSAQEVLKSKNTMDKTDLLYKDISHYLGNGLLTMDGTDYARHRKMVGLGLRKSLIKAYVPLLDEYMPKLVEDLREKANGGKCIDSRSLIELHLLNMSTITLTSEPTEERFCMMESVGRNLSKLLELLYMKMVDPVRYMFEKQKKTSKKNELQIKEKLEHLRWEVSYHKDRALRINSDDDNYVLQTIYAAYLKSEEYNGNDDEIYDQTRTLVIANFETTYLVVNCVLIMLALEQDIQQRVLDEINLVLGDEKRRTELEDLEKMEYTERVIKECIRLFPPGAVIGRKVREETQFKEFVAPKGSSIIVNTLAIHRNPEYYPDPLKFDPDRFLPEVSKGRHACAYLGFSFGTRSCPGQLNAYVMIKLILCYVLRSFKILPGDNLRSISDIKVKMMFSLRLMESSLRYIDRNSAKV